MGELTTLLCTHIGDPVRFEGHPDAGFTDNAASYGVIVREILGQGREGLGYSHPSGIVVARPQAFGPPPKRNTGLAAIADQSRLPILFERRTL